MVNNNLGVFPYFTYIVQEFSTGVTLDVVSVEVTPSKLNVDPELVAGGAIQDVLALCKE